MGDGDGKVTIDTGIDTSGIAKGVKAIKDMLASLGGFFGRFTDKLKGVGNSVSDALVSSLDTPDIDKNISNLEIINREYEELLEIQKKYQDAIRGQNVTDFDASEDLKTLDALNKKIENLQAKIRVEFDEGSRNRLEAELEDLIYKAKAAAQGVRGSSELNEMLAKYEEASAKAEKVEGRMKRVEESSKRAKKAFSAIGDSVKNVSAKLKGGLVTILKYAFGIRTLFTLFSKMKAAAKEGFGALAEQFPAFNESLSLIMNALSRLKYSFAAAFAPLVTSAAPLIKSLVDMLTGAITKIGEFIAALSGQQTYYRAIETQESYAKSLNDTAEAAKEAKGQLMGFDKLNVINTDSGSAAGGKGKGSTIRYEEVPVSKEMQGLAEKMSALKDMFAPVKDAFSGLFKTIKQEWQKFLQEISPFVMPVLEAMTGLVTAVVEHIGLLIQGLAPVASKVVEVVSPILLAIIDGVTGIFDKINKSGVIDKLGTALSTALTNAKPLFDLVSEILTVVFDIIGRLIVNSTELGNHILPIIGNVIGFIGQVLGVVWEVVKPIIDGAMELGDEIIPAIGGLLDTIGGLISGIFSLLKPIISWVGSLVKKLMPSIKKGLGAVGKVIAGIIELLSWILGGFKGGVLGLLKKIGGGIASIALTIAQTFVDLVRGVTDFMVKVGLAKKESVAWVDEWTAGLESAQKAVDDWANDVEDASGGVNEAISSDADDVLLKWDSVWEDASNDTSYYLDNIESDVGLTLDGVSSKAKKTQEDTTRELKKSALSAMSEMYHSGQISADEYERYLAGISSTNAKTVTDTCNEVIKAYNTASVESLKSKNEIKRQMDELYQKGVITWGEYRAYLQRINNGEKEDKKKALDEIVKLYNDNVAKFKESGKRAGSVYVSSFTEEMAQLKQKAQTWGKDICEGLSSGVNENTRIVAQSATNLANNIKQRVGFSEPEKGPLSDFHTYMPDMLKLMAYGIKTNSFRAIDEVTALGEGMKNSLAAEYASLASVKFVQPAISTGRVLPYNMATTDVGYSVMNEMDSQRLTRLEEIVTAQNQQEQALLRELINVVRQKNLTISPSASLGKVVNASTRLYAGVTG